MIRKLIAVIAVTGMASAPALARPADNPAAKLSLSAAKSVPGNARASANADDARKLRGGFIIPLVALIAIILGVLAATSGDDGPDSP